MPASAGQRNVRLRFERRAATSDGMGNSVGAWQALCGPVWARLTPIRGREEILQQRLAGVTPYELTVLSSRATREVTNADRVVNDRTGDTFDIVDISNPDERNIELVMLVKRGGADG